MPALRQVVIDRWGTGEIVEFCGVLNKTIILLRTMHTTSSFRNHYSTQPDVYRPR